MRLAERLVKRKSKSGDVRARRYRTAIPLGLSRRYAWLTILRTSAVADVKRDRITIPDA